MSFKSVTRSLLRTSQQKPFTIHVSRQAVRISPRQKAISKFKPLTVGFGLLLGASFIWGPTIRLDTVVQNAFTRGDNAGTLDEQENIVDPATGIEFPKTLRVTAKVNIPLLTCVGVGVRTVSFLGIQVYSIGFYADLNNPNLKLEPNMTAEQKIDHIVRTTTCVLRIVPTRSTSYSHLRDAFMRAMQSKLSSGGKSGTISDDDAAEIASPLRKLKTLFPNTALSKHTPFDIFLSEPAPGKHRALVFRDLGSIEHDWVATEFVLHYFEGDGPSPPMKKAVVDRIQSLYER
ncbi:hypothetical protein E1B28_001359 [Marasmius oreades]|uniref:Chalcone isomerase domain-containing protein n=1 Tax=Marasmius oreades TaxID=181124 RepID=A0A9P7V3C9_9AGAR|nr:uncharacterized protein E1B28_001359 [Marasmius oreades]KAG7099514.1 hypothetical protein E1B28_001359 [Marasmius oreades]